MSTITIETQPSSVTKFEGESVVLSVVATSTVDDAQGVLSYQWERKNKRTGDFVPIGGATDSSLTIPFLSSQDDNDYRCVVTNSYKSKTHLDETLIKTSYGSESVLVDDEYKIGYRSFSLRTEPSTIHTTYPKSESIDIQNILKGRVESVQITNAGENYTASTYTGKILTGATSTGDGATADILVEDIKLGAILKFSGFGYTNGYYEDVPLMSSDEGSGQGARGNILIANQKMVKAIITDSGTSYEVGDQLLVEKPLTILTKLITQITKTNPGVITCPDHEFSTGDSVTLSGIVGMQELNDEAVTITVINADTFSIGVDTTSYTTYVSGGNATANPAIIVCLNHGLTTGDIVTISGVGGIETINDTFGVTVLTTDTFKLHDVSNPLDFFLTEGHTPYEGNTGFVSVLGGEGFGAELEVRSKAKSGVTSVILTDSGADYSLGDLLTTSISGGSDFEVKVTSINTTITTTEPHGLEVNDVVGINDVLGMTQINQLFGTIMDVPSSTTITLNIDSSAFVPYLSGGYVIPQVTKTVSLGTTNQLYITSKQS